MVRHDLINKWLQPDLGFKKNRNKNIMVIKLIKQKYGAGKITPNLHLSLHLHECAYNYEPLYVFWCFLFEKMNGVLGKVSSYYINFITYSIL